MSSDLKKPPVAPKPKFVASQKLQPPPVAPKPDVILSHTVPPAKRVKPAVAPKPKLPKNAAGSESQSSRVKNTKEEQVDLSENLGICYSNNGLQIELQEMKSGYIIPTWSCPFDCNPNCTHLEHLNNPDIAVDPLEKLEVFHNGTSDGQLPPTVLSSRGRSATGHEKMTNKNQVVLKASFLEQKIKDVLVQAVSSNSYPFKCKSQEKHNSQKDSPEMLDPDLIGSTALLTDNSGGNSPECIDSLNVSNPFNEQGPVSECHQDSFGEDQGTCESHVVYAISNKALPIPKPRKLRNPKLLRQNCIQASTDEAPRENLSIFKESSLNINYNAIKSPKVCIHEQIVSYTSGECKEISGSVDTVADEVQSAYVKDCQVQIPDDTSGLKLNNLESGAAFEDGKTLTDNKSHFNENTDSFVRCSTLSMSLPKQVKLACNLPQYISNNVVTNMKNENTDDLLGWEGSPKIIPKKPQRHSLPPSSMIKREISPKLSERNYQLIKEEKKSNEEENVAAENRVSLESTSPKAPQEKQRWKLPHPILPFLGHPESPRTGNTPRTARHITAGKFRSKSFSSADVERTDIAIKDLQKISFRQRMAKILDFSRLLTKGSQSLDSSVTTEVNKASSRGSPSLQASGKKNKTVKAFSAESHSPSLQRQEIKLKGQCEIQACSSSLSGSVGEPEGYSLHQEHSLEYENLPHYEEIPEYMNLAHLKQKICLSESVTDTWKNSSSLEDSETSVYEEHDPYEASKNYEYLMRRNIYDSPTEDHNCKVDNLHSDDEEISTSSDEDDSSSSSSKGEFDLLNGKENEIGNKKTKVVHIAKEIMSSEKVFVDVLKLLHIDFRDAVAKSSRLCGKPVIEDRILNQILYYLPQLYELNRDLLRELEDRIAHWNDHQRIADIFVKKGPYLKMYSTYIKEFDKNIALLDEQCKKNPSFGSVVKEFEMSPRCANLALKHYLLKPVQRIPQYRLLLTDYLKNLVEGSSDYKDTQAALSVVIEVANHANDIMKQGDNFQKLMQIQYSLNGHHEIVQPGRVFLKEGTLMKLSRKVMQPRMFFLFNDALLYTTPVQSGMYKLNNMLSLAGMKVSKPTQEAYQNEINIESVERSFILSASSAAERDAWLWAITKAIDDYAKKRITFSASKSFEEADQVKIDCNTPLGSKAPIWIPDLRATMCMICTCEFTLTWRRHHCRACGKIVCQACSSNKHALEYLKNRPARVCDHCYRELQKKENHSSPKAVSPSSKCTSSALSSVLHSIPSGRKQKKIPAALKEVSANTEDSSMSGYLYRCKGNKKQWKHLWFVIKNKVLYTYAASEDVAALESQPLLGFNLKEEKMPESKLQIQLYHKNTLFYIFKADDTQTAQRWIEAFQEAMVL
uniref:FYVE, RhoGEF and PH domain containing 6 n=1 Tax=Erpetoichthys calabaricus TaxID=27687 RepID=A0A8C4X721_ERPCA